VVATLFILFFFITSGNEILTPTGQFVFIYFTIFVLFHQYNFEVLTAFQKSNHFTPNWYVVPDNVGKWFNLAAMSIWPFSVALLFADPFYNSLFMKDKE
jgi:hypothetical protein